MAISWGSEEIFDSKESVKFEFDMLEEVEVFYFWLFHHFTRRARIVEREALEITQSGLYHADAAPAKPGEGIDKWKPWYKVMYKNKNTEWVRQGEISR